MRAGETARGAQNCEKKIAQPVTSGRRKVSKNTVVTKKSCATEHAFRGEDWGGNQEGASFLKLGRRGEKV